MISVTVMNAQCCRKSGQVSHEVSTEEGVVTSEESVRITKGKQACFHMHNPSNLCSLKNIYNYKLKL